MSEASLSPALVIRSHKGPYEARFAAGSLESLGAEAPDNAHIIVDARVARLYAQPLAKVLARPSVLRIEATEEAKSLDRFPAYVEHLVDHGVRRDHVLLAVGGGITQDIACFLAATLLRGVDWHFWPTTLLAQADSCIGSKSSINAGSAKNILGTFTPPRRVTISGRFLDTLDPLDVRSGVGEMLKAHAIDGPESFARIAADYERLFGDRAVLADYVRRSLLIKKRYIEEDEFDQGPRNLFNYGHSFGHALEAATAFAIPHGIAVTIGMDMANYVAAGLGVAPEDPFRRMHPVLRANYAGHEGTAVPMDSFLGAIAKDKKNVGAGSVTLVLPGRDGRVFKGSHPADGRFRKLCAEYLEQARAA